MNAIEQRVLDAHPVLKHVRDFMLNDGEYSSPRNWYVMAGRLACCLENGGGESIAYPNQSASLAENG